MKTIAWFSWLWGFSLKWMQGRRQKYLNKYSVMYFIICRHGGLQSVLKQELQLQSANQNGDHHLKRLTRLLAMQSMLTQIWMGFVIRNHLGNAVAAGSGSADLLMSAQHAEAIACMKGLEFAATLGMRRVIVETNATIIAKMLSDTTYDRPVLGSPIGEIRSLMYDSFSECPKSLR